MDMGSSKRVLLVFSDVSAANLLNKSLLSPAGHLVTITSDHKEAEKAVSAIRPNLLILSDGLKGIDSIELANRLIIEQPTLPIILSSKKDTVINPRDVLHLGLVDWLNPPIDVETMREAIERGLQRSDDWENWFEKESKFQTGQLLETVDELETLIRVGRTITGKLELDNILTSVVEAAVELTNADEGSILLKDFDSGELYMRAARNFQEDFVQTFRIKAEDTIAGEVIKTGKPVFINKPKSPEKIKTSYLVHSLIYVPLIMDGKTFGVLGVDNQAIGKTFKQRDIKLLSALADYAVVAIENTRLFSETEQEKNKFSRILNQIEDGVLVYDDQNNIVLLNNVVKKALHLGDSIQAGKKIEEVFTKPDWLNAIQGEGIDQNGIEVIGENERIYQINLSDLEGIGKVASLFDITDLKDLYNLKTDFVNTVSHDLRSPLTSIIGYLDLIQRVGNLSDEQKKYIENVNFSVHSITSLINELLNLGRLEVIKDNQMEEVALIPTIQYSVEGFRNQAEKRSQTLSYRIDKKLPNLFGNPIQLRQMMDNLIGNAIKYTPKNGKVDISAKKVANQVVIQVSDTGAGIPEEELSKIFEKFYRLKNMDGSIQGTGLGLAITKTIVGNHRGKIDVKSKIGKGSVFTVTLPILNGSEKNKN